MTMLSIIAFRDRAAAKSQSKEDSVSSFEIFHYSGTRLGDSSTFLFLGGSAYNYLTTYQQANTTN